MHWLSLKNVVVAALMAVGLAASAQTVSFEGLSSTAQYTTGSTVPEGARLSNQLASVSGVVFRTIGGAPYVAVVRLGAGHATTGTNGIGGASLAGGVTYGLPIEARFVLPSNPAIPAVVNYVTVRGDRAPISGTVTLEAFDTLGNSIGSATANDQVGVTLGITNAAISAVRVSGTSGTVAYDDLSFSPPTPAFVLWIQSEQAGAEVCWFSAAGRQYQLEYSADASGSEWMHVGTAMSGNGETLCVPVTVDQSRRFYRVALLP